MVFSLLFSVVSLSAQSDFFDAVKRNDDEKVDSYLKHNPELIYTKTPNGKTTALQLAVIHNNDTKMLKRLISAGVDVGNIDTLFGGRNAYQYAEQNVENGKTLFPEKLKNAREVYAFLKSYHEAVSKQQSTLPIWGYMKNHDVEKVEKCFKRGTSLDDRDSKGRSPMNFDLGNLDTLMVKMLLGRGIGLSSVQKDRTCFY